jgi:hypothetical protein
VIKTRTRDVWEKITDKLLVDQFENSEVFCKRFLTIIDERLFAVKPILRVFAGFREELENVHGFSDIELELNFPKESKFCPRDYSHRFGDHCSSTSPERTLERKRLRIFIENKIDAGFQSNQAKRYHLRGRFWLENRKCEDYRIILCAPKRYIDVSRGKREEWFEHLISYEELDHITNYRYAQFKRAIQKCSERYG